LYLVVSDIQAARKELADCGVDVSEVFHRSPTREKLVGPDPQRRSYGSLVSLAGALRRAEAAHGEHEKRAGQKDANWPDWYAQYMLSEQGGVPPPL
jgi:hypothetical protein